MSMFDIHFTWNLFNARKTIIRIVDNEQTEIKVITNSRFSHLPELTKLRSS